MPFMRVDDDGFEVDGDDNVTYTGDFKYYPPAEVAYKPQPFDPGNLSGLAGAACAMLREVGVERFRVRYDGGHDEGFAHADAGRTADGVEWSIDDLAAKLGTPQRVDTLRAALGGPGGNVHPSTSAYLAKMSPAQLVGEALDGLADAIASCLLGKGYGTGEYSMYGALTADLATGELTDEPSAPRPPDLTFD